MIAPEKNSTNAYLDEKATPQLRHFPPNLKYPKTGILSIILTGTLQEKQCEPGKNKLIFFDNLKITTFKKLPIEIPNINNINKN